MKKNNNIALAALFIFTVQSTVCSNKPKKSFRRTTQQELKSDTEKIARFSQYVSQNNCMIAELKKAIAETTDNVLKKFLQSELEVTEFKARVHTLSLNHEKIMKQTTIEIDTLGKTFVERNTVTLNLSKKSESVFFATLNNKIEQLYSNLKKKFETAIKIQEEKKLIIQKMYSTIHVSNYQETINQIDELINDHKKTISDMARIIKSKVVNQACAQAENHIEKKALHVAQELRHKQEIENALIKKTKKAQTIAAAQQAFKENNNLVESVLAAKPPVTHNPDNTTLDLKITQEEILRERAEKEQEIQRLNAQAAQEKAIRNQLRATHTAFIATPSNEQDVKSTVEKQTDNPTQTTFSITAYEHFKQWFMSLDKTSQEIINERIQRLQAGDFGDARKIITSDSLWELRIKSTNPQSRVYYDCRDNHIHILCGGKKAKQQQNIELAISLAKKLPVISNTSASK